MDGSSNWPEGSDFRPSGASAQADSRPEAATIFALATPPGKSGVALIRLSGPQAGHALEKLTGCRPQPRHAQLARLRDPATGELLDRGLVLFFPGPASFTGEDVGELQVHGSLAVIDGVLDVLTRLPGLAPAEAGEFARRAFINGKIDLTQAEGLGDLIEAQTPAQRALALRQAGGHLHRLIESLRQEVLTLRARMEALLDFPDEEDVPAQAQILADEAGALAGRIAEQIEAARAGEVLRRGARAVLLGKPNVGKSSLFNRLAAREAALTSPEAGTTRDVLQVELNLSGYAVILHDSAGLDEDPAPLAKRARERAQQAGEEADIRVLVREASCAFAPAPRPGDLLVCNKIDLATDSARPPGVAGELGVSAQDGRGLDELREALAQRAKQICRPAEISPLMTRARQRAGLQRAHEALLRAQTCLADGGPAELAAESLREAGEGLGQITGQSGVEEMLDIVFSRFCIGK